MLPSLRFEAGRQNEIILSSIILWLSRRSIVLRFESSTEMEVRPHPPRRSALVPLFPTKTIRGTQNSSPPFQFCDFCAFSRPIIRISRSIRTSDSMADFEAVSARVFEKQCVIAGFAEAGTFQIASSGATHDFGQSIDFRRALRPKCNARFVRNIAG